jgi:hypothetical protein
LGRSSYPVLLAHRQFLGCVQKFNRLIQICNTGVRPENLDDQATGCGTEPTSFFKIFKIAVEGRDGDIKSFGILIDVYLADFAEPVDDFFLD